VADEQNVLAAIRARPWFGPLARLPMVGFRLGLGRIVGRRYTVLTTTGRSSGRPRRTMTAWHRGERGRYVLVLYGTASQWYRNVRANPIVTGQTAAGAHTYRAARVEGDDNLLDAVAALRRSPLLWRFHLAASGLPDSTDELLGAGDRLVVVRLDPVWGPGPPPMPADLVWLWPLALALLSVWSVVRRRRRSGAWPD
jgi:deazaflavin-dependent oxidoreductase (nitroreductase family)